MTDVEQALKDFKEELHKALMDLLTRQPRVDPLSPDGMDRLLTVTREALERLGPEEITRRLVCYYGPDDRTEEEKRQRYAPPIMVGWADTVSVGVVVEKEPRCTCPHGHPGAFRRTVRQQGMIDKCAVHGGKKRSTR